MSTIVSTPRAAAHSPYKYLEVARITWQSMLAYQADTWLGALFSGTRVLLAFLLWSAIFAGQETVAGYTLPMMITYSLLATMISRMQNQEAGAWQLAEEVREGQFSKYLARPLSVHAYFLAAGFGRWAFMLVVNLVTLLVWGLAFSQWVVLPRDPLILGWLALLLPLGALFMLLLNHTIGLLSLKFVDVLGFMFTKGTVVELLSGALIPLTLLPDGLVNLLRYTPVYYVVYYPVSLFLGVQSEPPLLAAGVLAVWCLVLWAAAEAWYRYARKFYEGVGV
jgi:ABC-2 type transport system permease protein